MSHHNFASFQEQEVELLTYVGYKIHEHPCKDHFQWVTSPSAQLVYVLHTLSYADF
ncbi:hypothetical protein DAI22_07g060300 [Oryza sativa Japonica Group]|nr:hypothetical protein DAI22_07g060300 [Oryza sativa Japonica Group]